MKITEEDIDIYDDTGYLGVFIYYPYSNKKAKNDIEWSKELKQQILDNQEKAEKFDACLRNPNERMHWSGSTINKFHLQIENNKLLEKENKQLKEKLEKLYEHIDSQTLKEILKDDT